MGIHDVMSTSEACAWLGIDRNRLERAIDRGELVEGVDCRKAGNGWLYDRESLRRVFDRLLWQAEPGHIYCTGCDRHLPHDEAHFRTYRARNGEQRLTRTCRDCNAARLENWRHKNRDRVRARQTAYMQVWRRDNPGYQARAAARKRRMQVVYHGR